MATIVVPTGTAITNPWAPVKFGAFVVNMSRPLALVSQAPTTTGQLWPRTKSG